MEQMKSFLISYDLVGPERDYNALKEKIQSIGTWARPLESVWIVKSTKDAGWIRDALKTVVDSNDKLLVVKLSGNWASRNISKQVTDWMKTNL